MKKLVAESLSEHSKSEFLHKLHRSVLFNGTLEESKQEFPDIDVIYDETEVDLPDKFILANADTLSYSFMNKIYEKIGEGSFVVIQTQHPEKINTVIANKLIHMPYNKK
jgi:hypothetical protein